MAIARENFFWHKLHSLTGILPIGFYMLQHLTLNSFSFAGPEHYNAVINFFASMPKHILWMLEWVFIYLPLLFHGVYGLFIVSRAQPNFLGTKYKFTENFQYSVQRYSGIALFFLLIAHIVTTTVAAKAKGEHVIQWQAWHDMLTGTYYIPFVLYVIGVALASWHLSYGVWNFCIRWGITVSERSQHAMQKFALFMFIAVTLLGWLALIGFLRPVEGSSLADEPTRVQSHWTTYSRV
jgi:succinate dehydrogenase / fumarate reductase cytochrome b subunit